MLIQMQFKENADAGFEEESMNKAIAHFNRTGLILPGYQSEIAEYLSNNRVGE